MSLITLQNFKVIGATVFETGGGSARTPPLVKDVGTERQGKGRVKLIKRVKIAYSFLQSVSDQFHLIILSLAM